MGARHYDPVSGRFLSQDPIGYPITLNLYTYVNGDPINFYDPDGRFISPAYQTISATRLMGALQIAGGAAETLVGAGLTYVSGGLALPVGTAAMVHGLDHFFTGINTVYTGKQQDTLTSHLLQQTGMSHGSAETIDMSLSLGFTMGGSALLNSVRSAATATQFANAASRGHAATATHRIGLDASKPAISGTNQVTSGNGFVGYKGFELKNTQYQKIRNSSTTIQGRSYSGHALDQMQNRGFTPSVVEEAIYSSVGISNKVTGRIQFYDSMNNISVVTENDKVVTVMYGRIN